MCSYSSMEKMQKDSDVFWHSLWKSYFGTSQQGDKTKQSIPELLQSGRMANFARLFEKLGCQGVASQVINFCRDTPPRDLCTTTLVDGLAKR